MGGSISLLRHAIAALPGARRLSACLANPSSRPIIDSLRVHAGEYLVKGLGENGFVVDWVRNGVDAVG